MKKILKFNFGKISLYFLVYSICWIILIIIDLVKAIFFLDSFFINIYIKELGHIIGGLSIYLYQYKSFNKNKNTIYFGLKLMQNKANIKPKDKQFTIIILIFFSSIFDFSLLIIEYHFYNQMQQIISPFFKLRISSIITITSSLLCTYSLNLKLGKHHKLSLIFISLILILQIISEILMKSANILIKPYIFELFLKILRNVIISFIDCIDKYLYEFNYVNPFKIIIIEGIFKLIFIIIFTVSTNIIKLEQLKKFFAENTSGKICGYIFLLLGNFFFAGMERVYQIYCDVIYSPTIKSLADYIFLPIFNIFTLLGKQDFYGKIGYFIISEILSIIIDFFGCVYNEFIILFCCGLDKDTKVDISSRAELDINNPNSFLLEDIQIEENNSEKKGSRISLDNYYLNENIL